MKITSALLRAKGACADQRRTFAELFPDGVEITEAICLSVANKFDWGWAAASLLPAPMDADYKAKCAPLYADYEAKCAPLDADYKAKRAPLDADYEAKRAALYADYEAKCAPMDADYEAKRAPLDADYEAKCAAAFGRLAQSAE